MKTGRTLISLAQELQRQQHSKKDLVVPSPRMHFRSEAGQGRVWIDEPGSPVHYGITELAQRQLAEKLGIPFAYFQRMREDKPELLEQNVNTWLQSGNETRMIRTLNGRIRAVLSERYRRLDNFELAEHILPLLQLLPGARFESVELTETRMYLKVVTERLQCEIVPGDVVQAGVVISNSEVGLGMLSVQPLVLRLVCSNGLIASDGALRKTHLGRALGAGDEAAIVFKDDTLLAQDQAFFLQVRDVVQACVSQATFSLLADKLRRTTVIRLQGDPTRTVDVLAQRYGMNEPERVGVLCHLIQGGDLSAYGLVNAVTHYSQEIGDYDRATEFEALGGNLIELPSREWQSMAEAS